MVREATKPKQHPPNISLLEGGGDSIYMRCSFTYDFGLHDSLELSWTFYNGRTAKNINLNSTGKVEGKAVQGRALILAFPYRRVSTTYMTLTIKDVSLEDDGWYTCVAKTRLDNAVTQTGRLDVLKKTQIIRNPSNVEAGQGGKASLVCLVSIDSSLIDDTEVYWTHNGRHTQKDRNEMEVLGPEQQKFTHTITPVMAQDQGVYRCHIVTPYDTTESSSASVKVNGEDLSYKVDLIRLFALVKVSCLLSQWGDWTPCTASCGGGSRRRAKTILQEAKYGGKKCPPEREEVEECNQQCCILGKFTVQEGSPHIC